VATCRLSFEFDLHLEVPFSFSVFDNSDLNPFIMSEKTLFSKIIDREIPAKIEHEDEDCIVIHDINPQAPVHVLIIPKKPIPRVAEMDEDDQQLIGKLMSVASMLAIKMELQQGFRVVINNGPFGGETVPHLHVHLLGGRPLTWPPG